ncbi:2-C-methyl-D-erythritol 4-phosphate cytidylyltransferase [Peribacillus kribbensis]|uniref:2-C-methyl-D-erythritol 4-phosphate cytidylyltransferase n=1 Tax=Peribacillus kribbensis TaxID=356658 RepID=UPI00040D1C84|nr:2-C-methyl-D-erythritol 4-phosphate cytidylyltransferase [Peribacillus kribbensis]
MFYEVIIPAAGKGSRMGAGRNKLFLELSNIPLIVYTLRVFEQDPSCQRIILPINPNDSNHFKSIIKQYGFRKEIKFVTGGSERQESVYNGVQHLSSEDGLVLVHDGARPFIDRPLIRRLAETAAAEGGAIAAVPVKDTIKKVKDRSVVETVERSSLWAVQTPQAFRISLLKEAHARAKASHFLGTDEASLVEEMGGSVSVIKGDYDNIKITTPEDLFFAEAILLKHK